MKPDLTECYELAGLEFPSQIEDKELLLCDSTDSHKNGFDNFLASDYMHLGTAELTEDDLLTLDRVKEALKSNFHYGDVAKVFNDFIKHEIMIDKIILRLPLYDQQALLKTYPSLVGMNYFQLPFLPTYEQYKSVEYIENEELFTFGDGNLKYTKPIDKRAVKLLKSEYGLNEQGYIKLIKDKTDAFKIICIRLNDFVFFINNLYMNERKEALARIINELNELSKGGFDKIVTKIKGNGIFALSAFKELTLSYYEKIYVNTLIKNSGSHFYILGATRSGKSELLKYIFGQEHIKQKKNAILIDPHGDLSEEFVKTRLLNNPKKERNLIYVDASFDSTILKAFKGDIPNDIFLRNNLFSDLPIINPLEIPKKYRNNTRVIENTAKNIVNAFNELITADRDQSYKVFSVNMEMLLIPCISALLRRENSTLFDLQDFMDDERNEDFVKFAIKHCSERQKTFFERKFYSKKLEATKEAIYGKLQALFNFELFTKMMCGKSTIDLEKSLSKDCRIIFRLEKNSTSGLQEALGVFITTSILNASYRLTEGQRRGTYFIIDEFQNFVTDTIEEALSQSRKYGLSLVLAHQNTKQIRNSKVKSSISANTEIKLLGKSDADDHTFFSKKAPLSKNISENAMRLKAGQFYLFNGISNATLITVPNILIKAERLESNEWQYFLLSQYEKYYKPKTENEVKTKPNKEINIKYTDF